MSINLKNQQTGNRANVLHLRDRRAKPKAGENLPRDKAEKTAGREYIDPNKAMREMWK